MTIWQRLGRRKADSRSDPERFFASLLQARIGHRYTEADRKRDFQATFSTLAGRRVLWQIFEWTHMFRPISTADPHETYRRDGERNIGLRILATMNAEPTDRPSAARNSKEHEHGAS